jgi:hypothetical protein
VLLPRAAKLSDIMRAQSWCRCGRGGPSPGADVAGVGPVLVQMWPGWAQSRPRRNRGDGRAQRYCRTLTVSWRTSITMRARAHSGRGSAGAYRFVCVPACPRECVRAHQCVCVPTSVRACVLCVCVCARAAACLCVHVRESASVCLCMRAIVHVHARARVDGGDEQRGRGVVHTVMTTMYTLNSMRSTTYGTNCTLASVRSKSGAPQRQRKTSGAGHFRAETSARKLPRRTHPVQTTQTCEPTSAAGTCTVWRVDLQCVVRALGRAIVAQQRAQPVVADGEPRAPA